MDFKALSLIGIFFLSTFPAFSQTGAWKDRYAAMTSNPWVRSSNPAGIIAAGNVSTVHADLQKDDGGLIDIHESDNSLIPKLGAASYRQVSDRLTFFGAMDYSYFTGKNMGGPVLADPYYNPVNFLESTDTTTGKKTLEKYTLQGALACSLSEKLVLAGKFTYQSANYAKRKDPRGLLQWMDMDASVGARYTLSRGSLGLNATYRKTLESVKMKNFGTLDRKYYNFVDFGGYFGKVEIIDGDEGYLSSSERPMFNQFFGGDVQANLHLGGFHTFLELGAARRSGYYGKKATESVRFCDFNGLKYDAFWQGDFSTGSFFHKMTASFTATRMKNNENTYRYSYVPGQGSEIQYFGSQETGDRLIGNLSAGYSFAPKGAFPARWAAHAGFDRFFLDQTATLYPYYRKQRLNRNTAWAEFLKNFLFGRNYLSLTAGGSFTFPTDDLKFEDGAYASAEGKPRTADVYLNKNHEYFHIRKLGVSVALRYTVGKILSERPFAFFAEVSDRYLSAIGNVEYLPGSTRNKLIFTIGCNF